MSKKPHVAAAVSNESRLVSLIESLEERLARLEGKTSEARKEIAQRQTPPASSMWSHANSTVVDIGIDEGLVMSVSDMHYPYQDKRAMEIFLKNVQKRRPKRVIVNGDAIDNYLLSDHDHDPDRSGATLQEECDSIRPDLKEICRWAAEVHYIMGNHEERMYRLIKDVPALYAARALEFKKLAELPAKVQVYPYLTKLKVGKLYFHHGQIANSRTAKATYDKFRRSMVVGHAHRADTYIQTDAMSLESHIVIVQGTMCDIKQARYVDHPAWTTGFMDAEFWRDDDGESCFSAQHRLIVNNTLSVNGVKYRA